MHILDKIIAFKKREIEDRKHVFPIKRLEDSEFFRRSMPSFSESLATSGPSIIGEFKRKSPSLGIINFLAEVDQVAKGYENAGISAISILTDAEFFGGKNHDLQRVAAFSSLPLLRKDFIIDEYQVVESRSIGATAILLIASILSKRELKKLSGLASELGMDVLFEIHDKKDLEKMNDGIRIVGINNRNLKNFSLNTEHSARLIKQLPGNCIKVAESGIQSPDEVKQLYDSGFNAFLIGERFMRFSDPGNAASVFMQDLKKLYQ